MTAFGNGIDAPRYTIYVCPDCGEHITETAYEVARGHVHGHYHDAPEGWWTDDGPGPDNLHGEDPWIDAVAIEVVPVAALPGDESA